MTAPKTRKKKSDFMSLAGLRFVRCLNCGNRGRVNPYLTRARTIPVCRECRGRR